LSEEFSSGEFSSEECSGEELSSEELSSEEISSVTQRIHREPKLNEITIYPWSLARSYVEVKTRNFEVGNR
jgi:hypothetical protein